jgi:hypothetical protein
MALPEIGERILLEANPLDPAQKRRAAAANAASSSTEGTFTYDPEMDMLGQLQ